MKRLSLNLFFSGTLAILAMGCAQESTTEEPAPLTVVAPQAASVVDNDSDKDVVKVAVSSPDHTTLVKAVQAADLVTSLSNAGPFTVFAPVNSAFDELPKGTLDDLLKPENKSQLGNILKYHVSLSTLDEAQLTDGRVFGQVNGGMVKITHTDGNIMINDAKIIASVRASNGIVHVIDKVLLPQ